MVKRKLSKEDSDFRWSFSFVSLIALIILVIGFLIFNVYVQKGGVTGGVIGINSITSTGNGILNFFKSLFGTPQGQVLLASDPTLIAAYGFDD
ncbi:MAG: hypothetical protein ACE5ES_02895 [Candidatus Nanoarchaeia archaeon]